MFGNIESQADRQRRAFDWFAVADIDATQALADAHGDATRENRRNSVDASWPGMRSETNLGPAEVPKSSLSVFSGKPG